MRVLIIDDHPIIIAACRVLLTDEAGFIVTGASDAASGLMSFLACPPEVCVIGGNLPSASGLALCRQILVRDPEARIVIFGVNEDPLFVADAIDIGVKGYVSKSGDPHDLVLAIREVREGGIFMSLGACQKSTMADPVIAANRLAQIAPREATILHLLASGRSLSEIAKLIGVSYGTVANDTAVIRHKLCANSNGDLVRLAMTLSAKLPRFPGC